MHCCEWKTCDSRNRECGEGIVCIKSGVCVVSVLG